MIPKGTIVVSVSHTGTRELCRQLGVPLEFHPTTKKPDVLTSDKVWHSHHQVPDCDHMVVPVRHPSQLADSYARRGLPVEKLVYRLDCMEYLLRNREYTLVPVDVPYLRDLRLREFGGPKFPWERTGHEDLPDVQFDIDYKEVILMMYDYTIFGDYNA